MFFRGEARTLCNHCSSLGPSNTAKESWRHRVMGTWFHGFTLTEICGACMVVFVWLLATADNKNSHFEQMDH